ELERPPEDHRRTQERRRDEGQDDGAGVDRIRLLADRRVRFGAGHDVKNSRDRPRRGAPVGTRGARRSSTVPNAKVVPAAPTSAARSRGWARTPSGWSAGTTTQ